MNKGEARRVVQGTLSAEMYRKSVDYPFSFNPVPGPSAPQVVEFYVTDQIDAYGYYPAKFQYLNILTGLAAWDDGEYPCYVFPENTGDTFITGKRYMGRLQGVIDESSGLPHAGDIIVSSSRVVPDAGCGLIYYTDGASEEYLVDVGSLAGPGLNAVNTNTGCQELSINTGCALTITNTNGVQYLNVNATALAGPGLKATANGNTGCDYLTINANTFYTFLGCGLDVVVVNGASLISVNLTDIATDGLSWDALNCTLTPDLGCGLHLVAVNGVNEISVDVAVLAGNNVTTSLISTTPGTGCPYLGVDLNINYTTNETVVTDIKLAIVNSQLQLRLEKTTFNNYYNAAGLLLSRDANAPITTNTNINACLFQTCCDAASLLAVIGESISGLTVNFTGTATNGVAPITWAWTFGDGGTSTAQNPSHTYAGAGTYTVGLTVTDACGRTASTTTSVTVAAGINVFCCANAINQTVYLSLSGGNGTVTLTYDGARYWTGSKLLSCGDTVLFRWDKTNCAMEFSCNGTVWKTAPCIGGEGGCFTCGPPMTASSFQFVFAGTDTDGCTNCNGGGGRTITGSLSE